MKSLLVLLTILLLNFTSPVFAISIDLNADCQERIRNGIIVYLSYSIDEDAFGVSRVDLSTGASVIGNAPGDFHIGSHHRVFAVELIDGADATWIVEGVGIYGSLTVRDDMDLPTCSEEDHSTGRPDGGIVTITARVDGIPGEQGCTWEIQNHGNPEVWDAIEGYTGIQQENGLTFCRLPLGNDNNDHDPSHYRATVRDLP